MILICFLTSLVWSEDPMYCHTVSPPLCSATKGGGGHCHPWGTRSGSLMQTTELWSDPDHSCKLRYYGLIRITHANYGPMVWSGSLMQTTVLWSDPDHSCKLRCYMVWSGLREADEIMVLISITYMSSCHVQYRSNCTVCTEVTFFDVLDSELKAAAL